jgi:chromosome partitioning protein
MNSSILEFRHSGPCACGRRGVRSTSAGQGVQRKHSCFLFFRQSPARRPFRRGLASPRYAPIALADLTTKLNALDAAGAAYLFIDTAPSVGAANAELFAAADLVLIPLNPTPADLRALVKGLPLIKQSGRPFSFVLTRVRPNLRNNDGAAMALEALGLVLATRMHERVIYAETFAHGKTAIEIDPAGVAGRELAALWLAVKERIH